MASGQTPGGVTVLNLASLNLQQLDRLKSSMEDEIGLLTASMAQLKVVQQKFVESKAAVSDITPAIKGKEILVPLTSSMYVPGLLKDTDTFICDIGTGYYVEKKHKDAIEFFERKTDYITSNLEKLQQSLKEKHKLRESIVATMQAKLQGRSTAPTM